MTQQITLTRFGASLRMFGILGIPTPDATPMSSGQRGTRGFGRLWPVLSHRTLREESREKWRTSPVIPCCQSKRTQSFWLSMKESQRTKGKQPVFPQLQLPSSPFLCRCLMTSTMTNSPVSSTLFSNLHRDAIIQDWWYIYLLAEDVT